MNSNIAKQRNQFICIGAALGLLAVLLGAFGAHALKGQLSETELYQYRLGVEYQFYHVGAVLFGALALELATKPALLVKALWGFVLGAGLFSGSLILLAITGVKIFAFITPLGGVTLLLAWAAMFMAFTKQ